MVNRNPNLDNIIERLKNSQDEIREARKITEKLNDKQGTRKLQERHDSITKDIEEFKSRGK